MAFQVWKKLALNGSKRGQTGVYSLAQVAKMEILAERSGPAETACGNLSMSPSAMSDHLNAGNRKNGNPRLRTITHNGRSKSMSKHFRSTLLRFSATGFLLTGLASVSRAVDGVILIEQSRALAGNVTPGDAPGFPVTITRSGSYRLVTNLSTDSQTFPGFNGIEVAADDVTIDLNGFTLSVGGYGISAGSSRIVDTHGRNLTIKNGTITGAGTNSSGITTVGYDTRVQDVVVRGNVGGISIGAAAGKRRAVIINSIVSGNVSGGITLYATDCLIEGNLISNNSGVGVEIKDPSGTDQSGGGCTIANNTINQNTIGILAQEFSGKGGVHIRDNTIIGNSSFGLGLWITVGASVAYGGNVFMGNNGGNANAQVGSIAGTSLVGSIQIGPNVCGGALCP